MAFGADSWSNETVALFLVDRRMPRMSGVEFLEKALEIYPEARRALTPAPSPIHYETKSGSLLTRRAI